MSIVLTIQQKLTILNRDSYSQYFAVSLKTAGIMLNEDREYFEASRITFSMFKSKYKLDDEDYFVLFPWEKSRDV